MQVIGRIEALYGTIRIYAPGKIPLNHEVAVHSENLEVMEMFVLKCGIATFDFVASHIIEASGQLGIRRSQGRGLVA